jgi:hypothetical protein
MSLVKNITSVVNRTIRNKFTQSRRGYSFVANSYVPTFVRTQHNKDSSEQDIIHPKVVIDNYIEVPVQILKAETIVSAPRIVSYGSNKNSHMANQNYNISVYN